LAATAKTGTAAPNRPKLHELRTHTLSPHTLSPREQRNRTRRNHATVQTTQSAHLPHL